MSRSGIESDDRVDAFGLDEFIVAEAIVARVVDGGVDRDCQFVLVAALEETIETFEREGEITFAGWPKMEMNRQVVTAEGNDVLIEAVAEVVDLAIMIEAPVGGRIGVETRATTFVVTFFAALAGGFAGRAGAGGESGAVAAQVEVEEIAEHSPAGGRNDGGGEEGIFQALEEIFRTRL